MPYARDMDWFTWLVPLVGAIACAVLFPLGMRRRSGGPTAPDLEPATRTQVEALLAADRRKEAVRAVRDATGWKLIDATAYVNALARGVADPIRPPRTPGAEDLPPVLAEQARLRLAQGEHVQAVKMVREHTGWPLKDAHACVRQLRDH